MIGSNLAHDLLWGNVNSVGVSFTTKDRDLPCTVFDQKLHDLSQELRANVPDVVFDSHGAAESHTIIFPADRSAQTSQKLIEILRRSEISITRQPHFLASFVNNH